MATLELTKGKNVAVYFTAQWKSYQVTWFPNSFPRCEIQGSNKNSSDLIMVIVISYANKPHLLGICYMPGIEPNIFQWDGLIHTISKLKETLDNISSNFI